MLHRLKARANFFHLFLESPLSRPRKRVSPVERPTYIFCALLTTDELIFAANPVLRLVTMRQPVFRP